MTSGGSESQSKLLKKHSIDPVWRETGRVSADDESADLGRWRPGLDQLRASKPKVLDPRAGGRRN
jgi:hypothetical protein